MYVPFTTLRCCDSDIEVCVLDSSLPAPVPFVDCTVGFVNGEPLIDFGVVSDAGDASRLVAVRNATDGNAPLVIYEIDEPGPARALLARGADRVETFAVGDLLAALEAGAPLDEAE